MTLFPYTFSPAWTWQTPHSSQRLFDDDRRLVFKGDSFRQGPRLKKKNSISSFLVPSRTDDSTMTSWCGIKQPLYTCYSVHSISPVQCKPQKEFTTIHFCDTPHWCSSRDSKVITHCERQSLFCLQLMWNPLLVPRTRSEHWICTQGQWLLHAVELMGSASASANYWDERPARSDVRVRPNRYTAQNNCGRGTRFGAKANWQALQKKVTHLFPQSHFQGLKEEGREGGKRSQILRCALYEARGVKKCKNSLFYDWNIISCVY